MSWRPERSVTERLTKCCWRHLIVSARPTVPRLDVVGPPEHAAGAITVCTLATRLFWA